MSATELGTCSHANLRGARTGSDLRGAWAADSRAGLRIVRAGLDAPLRDACPKMQPAAPDALRMPPLRDERLAHRAAVLDGRVAGRCARTVDRRVQAAGHEAPAAAHGDLPHLEPETLPHLEREVPPHAGPGPPAAGRLPSPPRSAKTCVRHGSSKARRNPDRPLQDAPDPRAE